MVQGKATLSNSIGLLASFGSTILWILLVFYNPYTHEPAEKDVLLTTFLTLQAPACIAFLSPLIQRTILMFIAFVWSLPISFFMAMSPGIFAMFGLTSILYLVSGVLMIRDKKRE